MSRQAEGEVDLQEKCATCPGDLCCTYFTQEIEAPRSKLDFDNLLWAVSHERTRLFKDEGQWYLLIENRCTHLRAGGGCAIYESRPQACRDYEADYCERDAPAEEGFELYFPDYESLLAYCKQRFKSWGR